MEYNFICHCGHIWHEDVGDDMEFREHGGFIIRENNNFKKFIICKDCRNFSSIRIYEQSKKEKSTMRSMQTKV